MKESNTEIRVVAIRYESTEVKGAYRDALHSEGRRNSITHPTHRASDPPARGLAIALFPAPTLDPLPTPTLAPSPTSAPAAALTKQLQP